MMANNDNDDNHCDLFTTWLRNNIKPNSSILNAATYGDIVTYLTAEDKTRFERKLKRKVATHNYNLMSYGPLNIENKLFIEVKNVSIKKLVLS